MQKISLSVLIFFLASMTIFSCVFSYPLFSRTTNLTQQNAFEINTYHETELFPNINDEQKVLELDWNDIDAILPFGEPLEIFLPRHNISFFAIRTGGSSHADIEPASLEDLKLLTSTNIDNTSWQLTPAIVKLSDNGFLPACLSTYSHGYKTTSLPTNGHFCLHFKNSKTHHTKQQDEKFQEVVSQALSLARKVIKQQTI